MLEQPNAHLAQSPAAPGQASSQTRDQLAQLRRALDIRVGEGRLVALLFVHSLFSFIAVSLAYTASTSLFLAEFGAAQLPYIFIIAALLMAGSGLVYTRLSGAVAPRRLFLGILLFLLTTNIVMRGSLALSDAGWLTFVLLVWYRLLFTLCILQFWGVANYLFTLQQGKRLFGIIGAGEMIGWITGFLSAALLAERLGTVNILWVTAISLAGALMAAVVILRISPPSSAADVPAAASPPAGQTTLRTLTDRPYFRTILLGGLFAFLLFFVVDFGFIETIDDRYDSAAALARFLGTFYAVGYGLGLAIRVGLTARILNRFGLRNSLAILPVVLVLLSAFIMAADLGGLVVVVFVLMLILRQAMELLLFTLYQPTALLLYQPLKVEQRVALQTLTDTDTVATPVGIGLAGMLLLLFQALPGVGLIHLAGLILVLGALWALVTQRSYRGYVSTLYDALNLRRVVGTALDLRNASSRQVIRSKLASDHAEEVIHALELLTEIESREELVQILTELSQHPDRQVRQEALRRMISLDLSEALPAIRERLDVEPDPVVQGAILRALCALDAADALEVTAAFLDNPESSLRQEALISLLRHGGIAGILIAGQRFLALTHSEQPAERALAATVLGHIDARGFHQPLVDLLDDGDARVRHAALKAAGRLQAPQLWPAVVAALTVSADRPVALNVLCRAGSSPLPAIADALNQASNKSPNLDLIRLCGQIRTPTARSLLWDQLAEADILARAAILQALSQSGYQAETAAERQRVEAEISTELSQAAQLLAALRDLADLTDWSPLRDALRQALERRRLNIFRLLTLLYDRPTILRVMDQIDSSSAAQHAYALELLILTISQEQKQRIWPLMERFNDEVRLEQLTAATPQPDLGLKGRLAAMLQQPTDQLAPWPRACALYMIGRERLQDLHMEVVAIHNRVSATTPQASAHHRLVGETAAWALERLTFENLSNNERAGDPSMILTVEKVIILKTVDTFSQIPDEILANLAQRLEEVELAAGERLFAKGEAGSSMYIIVSGQVRIHDGESTLSRLQARDVFGEMAILDPAPRMASATAKVDTLLLALPQQTLYELISTHGEVAQGIIRVLSRRLRQQGNRVQQLQSELNRLEQGQAPA